ncbi:MAG: hypothetical protein NVS1B7_0310 [Candidatus Saccharimonadales bacterium]
MTPLIAIAAIAGGLLLISLATRINGIFLFVALATGELLSHYIGNSAGLVLSGFIKGGRADVVGGIFLLWAPIVLTILFLRKSLPQSSLLFQFSPIALTSAATALITLQMLPTAFQHSVYATAVGAQISKSQDVVIAGAGVATFLLILLIGRPRHESGGKKSKRSRE